MIPAESLQLLKFISTRGKPKGRVPYLLVERERAMDFAEPLLKAGFIRERRCFEDGVGLCEGYQITTAGWEYLAGASD